MTEPRQDHLADLGLDRVLLTMAVFFVAVVLVTLPGLR